MKNYKLFVLLGVFGLLLTSCVKEENDYGNPQKDMENPYAVSVDQALTELDGVLQVIDVQTRGDKIRSIRCVETVAVHDVKAPTRGVQDETVGNLVHIVNFTDDEGYAILGADSRVPSVVAVVEKGNLTAAEYIDMANNGVPCDEFGNPVVYPPVVQLGLIAPPVDSIIGGGSGFDLGDLKLIQEPEAWVDEMYCPTILITKWDQTYYSAIYEDLGYNYYAGCVAVAAGQIFASNAYIYDKCPNPIGGRTIDWSTIKQSIRNGHANGTVSGGEYDAISLLLRAIGIASDMKYSMSGSGTTIDKIADVFVAANYYDVSCISYNFDSVVMMLWERHLPFLMGGQNYSSAGHAWVVDGLLSRERIVHWYSQYQNGPKKYMNDSVEEQDLLHCNFGASGKGNGYYDKAMVDLDEGPVYKGKEDTEGVVSDETVDDYRYKQMMITYNK